MWRRKRNPPATGGAECFRAVTEPRPAFSRAYDGHGGDRRSARKYKRFVRINYNTSNSEGSPFGTEAAWGWELINPLVLCKGSYREAFADGLSMSKGADIIRTVFLLETI